MFRLSGIILVTLVSLKEQLFAQVTINLKASYPLPAELKPLGDLLPLNDSSFLLPANGGLYSHNPSGWILPPDSNNIVISYQHNQDKKDLIFSVYHRQTDSSSIYWQYTKDGKAQVKQLAALSNGIFWTLRSNNALFIYGGRDSLFHIYEYTDDSLVSIVKSLPYFPTELHIMNQNTLLLALYDRILLINRLDGVKEFIHFNAPISSFIIKDEKHLFVTTPTDLCIYEKEELKTLALNTTGKLFLKDDLLYVLNMQDNIVKIFQIH